MNEILVNLFFDLNLNSSFSWIGKAKLDKIITA